MFSFTRHGTCTSPTSTLTHSPADPAPGTALLVGHAADMATLDPFERPPASIRNLYKKYQRMTRQQLDADPTIVDLSRPLCSQSASRLRVFTYLGDERLTASFDAFAGTGEGATAAVAVYEHEDMPGLQLIPSFMPPQVQSTLLSRLLHRDLSQSDHRTNVHAHYDVSYPPPGSSFFSISPTSNSVVAHPIDPSVHQPLGIAQLLNKKMRWMTLGGQYDWTQKRYPDGAPPAFPADIKALLQSVFDDTTPEAAIVNLYSPGDTLSMHRDVAESSHTGLISISLGCEALFVIGTSPYEADAKVSSNNTEDKFVAIRVPSGSAMYMTGPSRFAWHGVPQILSGTCPPYLQDWPAGDSCSVDAGYDAWRGWMGNKRVNLNVRQMWD